MPPTIIKASSNHSSRNEDVQPYSPVIDHRVKHARYIMNMFSEPMPKHLSGTMKCICLLLHVNLSKQSKRDASGMSACSRTSASVPFAAILPSEISTNVSHILSAVSSTCVETLTHRLLVFSRHLVNSKNLLLLSDRVP